MRIAVNQWRLDGSIPAADILTRYASGLLQYRYVILGDILREALIKSFDKLRMNGKSLIPFVVSLSNMSGIDLFSITLVYAAPADADQCGLQIDFLWVGGLNGYVVLAHGEWHSKDDSIIAFSSNSLMKYCKYDGRYCCFRYAILVREGGIRCDRFNATRS